MIDQTRHAQQALSKDEQTPQTPREETRSNSMYQIRQLIMQIGLEVDLPVVAV